MRVPEYVTFQYEGKTDDLCFSCAVKEVIAGKKVKAVLQEEPILFCSNFRSHADDEVK